MDRRSHVQVHCTWNGTDFVRPSRRGRPKRSKHRWLLIMRTSSDGSERSGKKGDISAGDSAVGQELGKESFTMLLWESGGCVPRFCLHEASAGQVLH
ncbi:unnamed protein product [Calypogeia fissa]